MVSKISRIDSTTQVITGHQLPLRYLGYETTIELMGELTGLVRVERPSNKDWLLVDARIPEKPHGVKAEEQPGRAGKTLSVLIALRPTR